MRFHTLKMVHFRQFIGEHTIHFAGINEDPNVTLIWGPNGYGKTGVFRAIMFCLYGDRILEQDGFPKSDSKGLLLVNEKMIEQNLGNRITTSVELTFDHEGSLYELSRKISAIMPDKDRDPLQEPGEVYLGETDPNGNTKSPIRDSTEVDRKIAQILSKRVRDYFLFDGERMERLTRYGSDQRKEVQRGIRSLLQIDALEAAIKGLKKQERELTQRIRANASGELEKVSEELQLVNEKIENLEDELRTYEDELQIMNQRKKEIDQELEKVKGLESKQERRKFIGQELERINSEKDKNMQDIRKLLERSGAYLANPVVVELKSDLEGKISRGELPADVRGIFIDHLLATKTCICERSLEEHSSHREALLRYKQQKIGLGMDAAYRLFPKLTILAAKNDDISNRFDTEKHSYISLRQQEEESKKELERLNEELKDIPEASDFGTELRQIERDHEETSKKITEDTYKLERERESREKLQEKEKALSQKDEVAKRYDAQRVEVQKAITTLEDIQSTYETNVKDELSKAATKIFCKLADQSTLKSLAMIKIDEDFQLDVLNNTGRGMLSQISSGQRQIVSLSYICALIQLGSKMEIPLLMDTPLGRLSGTHRDNCLSEIPKLAIQWIMILGTDTEIQEEETSALRQSGRWGKVYEIKAQGDRESILQQADLENWVPVRGK